MRRWLEVSSSLFWLVCALFALGIWSVFNGGFENRSDHFPSSKSSVFSAFPSSRPSSSNRSLFASSRPASQPSVRYSTFGRYIAFEPSAITRIGKEPFFLVADDKSEIDQSFSIFELTEEKELEEVHRFGLRLGGKEGQIRKLEATTSSYKKPGVFYAITAFDRPQAAYNRLLRFQITTHRDKRGLRAWKAEAVEQLPLFSPTLWIAKNLNFPWSKVEAISLSPDESSLILGVRAIGVHYTKPIYRVLLLRYALSDLQRPPLLLAHVDLQGVIGHSEGISALRYVPLRDQYLLTTSYEDDSRSPETAQVSGHLWIVGRDLSALASIEAWRNLPKIHLLHKPEGIEALGQSKAIVVYDDDGARKSRQGHKGKFHLAPNEASFSILPLPPMK